MGGKSSNKLLVNVFGLVLLIYIPTILEILIIKSLVNKMKVPLTFQNRILFTWLVMGICSMVLPYLYYRNKDKIKISQIGFSRISRQEGILCLFLWIVTYTAILYKAGFTGYIAIISLQNIGVALIEETFSKGYLYHQVRKINRNPIFVLFLCSFIFAFIMHNQGDFMTNLMFRFPLALVTGISYLKYGNIYLPMSIHLSYNLLITVFQI